MEISFQGPRMRGAQSTFQQWALTPLSSNQYWMPNDVIKIMGNISTGLIDFYRSHIQYTIEVTTDMMPVGLVQVDNSAQSLISQTILQSNQVQIERIQQYDTLAAVLTDIGFNESVAAGRSGQGIGFTNIPTSMPASLANSKPSQVSIDANFIQSGSQTPSYLVQYGNTGGYSPIFASQYTGTGYTGQVQWMQSGSDQVYSNAVGNMLGGSTFQTGQNWLTFPWNLTYCNSYTSQAGRALTVRAQYNYGAVSTGYPDAPYSIPLTGPGVKNQTWSFSTMLQQGFSPNNPYSTYYPAVTSINSPYLAPITPAVCGVSGYTKPFAPQFCRGTGQPFISPTIPQLQMVEGLILPVPIPMSRKTFRMPLISAILGVLIPPDQFKLIPAASLKNIILQISLNPYAFFTSGYSDVHQFDSIGMQLSNMQKRVWKIMSFQWVWHLYTFNSLQIQKNIADQLGDPRMGITISSNYWQLQAQYQLPNGSYVRNTFQIPANVQSLAQVWCIFLSNQYQTKTFCRKQFRLSNNVYSMQFKANGNYYPLQPILGNGGNPQTVDTTDDNWNFYQPLLLSNNFLFNTNVPLPRINTKNFAINGRIYNTNNRATLMDKSLYSPPPPQNMTANNVILNSMGGKSTLINYDTAMGQAWFHQNRYVGKAVYCYSFEPYGHSKTFINGLNTKGFRQFDVTFNNSPLNIFPSDQTLLIFSRANVLVKYTENGIQVIGA